MNFKTGDEVVCVDAKFADWAHAMYKELPIEGYTYTVRDVSMGREDINDTGLDSMVDAITLEEINNSNDPKYRGGKKELQFKASRFRKLTEVFDQIQKENTTIGTI